VLSEFLVGLYSVVLHTVFADKFCIFSQPTHIVHYHNHAYST